MNVIYAAKLEEGAKLPSRKHWSDAGMDLFAYQKISIYPQNSDIVKTGVTVEIPDGYVGIIKAKSRSNFIVGAGVVDSGYQGELLVKVFNPSSKKVTIESGEAIAQLIIIPCINGEVQEKSKKEIHSEASERGKTGGIVTQLSFLSEILTEKEARGFMEDSNES